MPARKSVQNDSSQKKSLKKKGRFTLLLGGRTNRHTENTKEDMGRLVAANGAEEELRPT